MAFQNTQANSNKEDQAKKHKFKAAKSKTCLYWVISFDKHCALYLFLRETLLGH